MRVNELSKELGKTNKEVLEILQKNNFDIKSHASNITEAQADVVRRAFRPAPAPAPAAPKAQETPAERGGQASGQAAAPKKRAVVFRPQNRTMPRGYSAGGQQRPQAPQGQRENPQPAAKPQEPVKPQAEAPKAPAQPAKAPAVNPEPEVKTQKTAPAPVSEPKAPAAPAAPAKPAETAPQSAKPAGEPSPEAKPAVTGEQRPAREGGFANRQGQQPREGGYQGNRQGGYQGNREGGYQGNRQGGFQGNREGGYQGNRQGGFQGNRQGGFQGNREGGYQGNRQGGFQGNREGGYQGNRQGGYQGNREGGYQGNRQGGFQGNREGGYQGNRQGGYQGNREGGYQGNRQGGFSGNREGGYQGNRQGGFQGNREGGFGGNRQGGYQGNRDGSRQGGFQGSRDGGRPAGRPGGGKPEFGEPVLQKQQNNKQNRNAYKNDKQNKKDRSEEMQQSRGQKGGRGQKPQTAPVKKPVEKKEEVIKTITLPESITIKELAEKMKLQPAAIVKKLFLKGDVVTINQEVSYEKAEEIAMEFDVLCEQEEKVDVIAELLKEEEESTEGMVERPPVVCVMGHVDHGKTSLLDAIRESNVTSREAGGITQRIGAYQVELNGHKITFLDTPGHEAFTAMRMRGAQATDIAVLVVAADDGVMPQTIEAINHAKAAGVEVIVAINKIDKPNANIDKVKQELIEYGLVPSDWGGTTECVPVSAHTQEGIPELLDMILLTAEVKELKANPDRRARGLVIEAMLDKGKGPVATVLVQKGTLKVGDSIAAGSCFGRVRAMMNENGRRVKEATPSTPVEILGLNDVPNAGEVFVSTDTPDEARSFAETFISESKSKLIEDTKKKLSLDDLFSQIKEGNVKELPIIVKADVQDSVEAVRTSLEKLSNEEVMVKVIHGGVGAINESDVSLAAASNAIVIGFNVRPDAVAKSIGEREKVDIRLYRVIYQAIDDVEAAMKGMLEPIYEEKVIGHGVIRQTFKASGVGTIAGTYVLDGKFQRGCKARITRDGAQIFDGEVASLKRFKDDVKEVAAGYECGLVFEKFNDLQEDDQIEAYAMVEVPR